MRFAPFPRKPKLHGHLPLWEGHKARYVRQQGEALAHTWAQATREEELRRFLRCSTCIQKRSLFFTRRQRPRGTKKRIIALCGAFSGRATSTAAVGVVHDSFISYSDGHRHRWSHNPFCVNRHDIFQNSTAEQRQFNETPSQRHVFCGKRHDPAVSASSRTRRQRCGCQPHAKSQPNQQRAPPQNGHAGQKARGRRGGTYPATLGECACSAWDDAESTHTSHGGNGTSHAKAGATTGVSCA